MAYSKTVYVNDSVPAISAENLNKSENELQKLSLMADEESAKFESKVDQEKTYSTITGVNHQGYLWNKTTKTQDSLSNYSYSVYSSGFNVGKFVAVTGRQASNRESYPIVIAYDSEMNVLLSYANTESTGIVTRYEFVVPQNTAYIYVNGNKTGDGIPKLESISFSSTNLADIENEIGDVSYKCFQNEGKIEGKIDKNKNFLAITGTNHSASLWNITSKSADSSNNHSYTVYSNGFNEGDIVTASGYQSGERTKYPVIMLYNSNMDLIKSYVKETAGTGFYEKEIVIPSNVAYIYVNGWISGANSPSLKLTTFEDIDLKDLQEKVDYLGDSKQDKPKVYSIISGGTENAGLWDYLDKETDSSSSYKYKVYSNGFIAGEYIAIDGSQPSNFTRYVLCCFYDSSMQLLGTVTEERSGDFYKKIAYVPLNCAYIYVNGKTSSPQPFIYNVSFQNVDTSYVNYELNNWMERRYSDGEYMTYTRKVPDHAVIAFSLDDSRADVSSASDLFITKEVPLCLATVPTKLNNVCDNGDTILETCLKTVENGGEILCHSDFVIDAYTTPEEYFTYFVEYKKMLEDAGLKINGIVKAGGGTDDPDIKVTKTYLRSFYNYGTGFGYINDNRYNIGRISMGESLDTLKSLIDNIADGGILFLFGHGASDLGEEWITKISDLIDYIGTVDNAEIVTIGEAFKTYLKAAFKE